MKKIQHFLLFILLCGSAAIAGLKETTVEYRQGNTMLEGYLVYDAKLKQPAPAVVIFHEWQGLSEYEKRRARQLARLGYVAFAADVYGKGVRLQSFDEAGKTSGIYKNNRYLTRARAQAAFDYVQKLPEVNREKIGTVGYCFGGMVSLELARSGADLKAVVGLHTPLDTPSIWDARNIQGKVLILHGADDPFVPSAQVQAFEQEMKSGNVDYRIVYYPGAVHAFTNPKSGHDKSRGAAYHFLSDMKSWREMKKFLKENLF